MKKFITSSALSKALSFVLVFAMAFSVFAGIVGVSATDADYEVWDGSNAAPAVGDGSQGNPYQISNGAELNWVARLSEADSKDKYFVITEDIYLNTPTSAAISYNADGHVNPYELRAWPSGGVSNYAISAFGVFAGAGYLAMCLLFASVREKLEYSTVPKWLEGLPMVLITAALIALAFSGFSGIKFI